MAETALASGADSVAVALVEEGIRLREAGIDAPILLLSEPPPEGAHEVVGWNLTPTVYRHAFLEALMSEAGDDPIGVHLKVDTGMHRVGVEPERALELVHRIARGTLPLRLDGVWTHFAVAEEDRGFTVDQLARFEEFVDIVRAEGVDPGVRHAANSAATILEPSSRLDMVRPGLAIYGLYPSQECRDVIELRPAMRVVSHVSLTRRLAAGARPSYGRRRMLASDSTVATVPVGYADGVPRLLSDSGEVLVGGRRRPLAGTVTMDQIVVDVGDDQVTVGDEVMLIGSQGDEEITADEWAEKTDTISYEVVCGIGPRLPRRYPDREDSS